MRSLPLISLEGDRYIIHTFTDACNINNHLIYTHKLDGKYIGNIDMDTKDKNQIIKEIKRCMKLKKINFPVYLALSSKIGSLINSKIYIYIYKKYCIINWIM